MHEHDPNLFLESGSEQNPQPIPAAQKGWEERDGRYFVNSSNMTARERELMGRSAARMKITLGTLNVRAKNNVDTISAITNQAVESAVETLDTERERAIAVKEASELRVKANIDGLTKLFNRTKILELLTNEILRSVEADTETSILMFDIDYFKQINDKLGHAIGDDVLKAVADVIIKNARPNDNVAHARHLTNEANPTLETEERRAAQSNTQAQTNDTHEEPGRFGGEELLVITKGANGEKAYLAAERIRRKIEELDPFTDGKTSLSTTTSVGVGTLTNQQKEAIKAFQSEIETNGTIHDKQKAIKDFISKEIIPQMLKQADLGLYAAKEGGRNRTVIIKSPPSPL